MVGAGLSKRNGGFKGIRPAIPVGDRQQPGTSVRTLHQNPSQVVSASNADSDEELLELPFILPPEPVSSRTTNRKRIQADKKLALLELILEKRDILFAQLSPTIENRDKQEAWEEVRQKALALEIVALNKDWAYVRDKVWGIWKSRSLEKRDNSRKTGAAGGSKYQLTDVDNKIFQIIGEDSPVIRGFAIPESLRPAAPDRNNPQNEAIEIQAESEVAEAPSRKKRRVISSETSDLKRKTQIELMKVEIYYKKLECLKLERELKLLPSAFTKDIPVPVHEQVFEVINAESLD